jgi:tRNA pseudouridine55 synthase
MIGFLVVDKPGGMTSHDVVAHVRRGISLKRIGHTGTLDPMATGVLILCLDEGTRLAEYVTAEQKEYIATVRLGIETDSYDADGRTTVTVDASHINRADFEGALGHFRGDILQTPPMVSAIKQGGVPLHELARAGKTVERAARPVHIYEIELLDWQAPDAVIRVVCSVGTYIRSIAHDLGEMLAVGAHLTTLRRTRVGVISNPIAWDTLQTAFAANTWQQYVINENLPLHAMPTLTLDAALTAGFQHGQPLLLPDDLSIPDVTDRTPIRLYDPAQQFIGIGEFRVRRLWPVKVFQSQVPS